MLLRAISISRHGFVTWTSCAVLLLFGSSAAWAGSINYGDFGPDFPPGVTIYLDVKESSGTDPVPPPLYGPPSLSGDTLDFDPAGFVASATGGDEDITDGQLNFDLMVLQTLDDVAGGVTALAISESGDFTLYGSGTTTTSIAAGIFAEVVIFEVDGVAVDPITVVASTQFSTDLVSSPGLVQPWGMTLLIDFGPALINAGLQPAFGATKMEVVIDDQLVAVSEDDTVAYIAKKDFTINPVVTLNPDFEPVPEPATALLLLTVIAAAARRRGRDA